MAPPLEVPAVTGIRMVQVPSVLLARAGMMPSTSVIAWVPTIAVRVPSPGEVVAVAGSVHT
ncbi:MAG: hypothetical protein MZV70_63485 [Desulfobacterales bacterium]|nr:hypothetical protein [Desulfobacterales bacterium]